MSLQHAVRRWTVIAALGVATLVAPSQSLQADQLVVDGTPRTYDLHVPAAARKPAPLVLVLHGGGGNGRQIRGWTGFDAVADKEGLIVAYPDAIASNWNDGREQLSAVRHQGKSPDDVVFLTRLVADLVARGLADKSKVYVTGASNGGMMTFRLACETSGVFAAYAAVVANLSTELSRTCAPKAGVRMLMINGTADTFVPYGGGSVVRNRGTVISAEATFAHWSKLNGCTAPTAPVALPDRDPADGSRIETISCPAGRTMFYRVIGGGHQWPSTTRAGRPVFDRLLGPSNRDIDASDHIARFFAGKL